MEKYSDSSQARASGPGRLEASDEPLVLALDTGSPINSIALGRAGKTLAAATFQGGASSPPLLAELSRLLHSIGALPGDLERLVGVRGPGSFTGLRGGLATLLGLHQALRVPATAVPAFRPLAAQAGAGVGIAAAAVNALRGEWFVQFFEASPLEPLAPPSILQPGEIERRAPCTLVAFGANDLERQLAQDSKIEAREATPLAPLLLNLAAEPGFTWDSRTLASPLYLRAPAVRTTQGSGAPGL